MDISAFSNEDFLAKDWINSIFKDRSASSEENDVLLQSLVTKLQLYVEQVNSAIEENCLKVVNNLPLVINEAEKLNQDVQLLSEKVQIIKRDIQAIEENTDESVNSLERLDRLKAEMESVKQALHEADNWSILAADFETHFDSGNIEKTTSVLVNMQQSLNVLLNADDYEDKKMELEGLKNRLEANVSPHIVKAFTTSNFEEATKFVKIFNEIERLSQLLKYYEKCQKGSLCQYWKSLIDSDQDLNMAEQLRSLYDMLLVNWQKQIKWCDDVFPSPNMTEMMIDLYADVLNNLDPSIASCMDTALKQHSQPLLMLLELHQISLQFQQNLDSLYVFNNEFRKKPNWGPILKSLYAPYKPYASKYGTLERQLLDSYLWESFSKLDSQADLAECIRCTSHTIPIVMNIANESLNRCNQFTRYCAIGGLLTALKCYFLKYIDKYKDVCQRLFQQVSIEENWPLLKSCLSFQQTIGEFLGETKKFENQLLKLIRNQKNNLSAETYKTLILDSTALKEYEDLLRSVGNADPDLSLFHNVVTTVEKLSRELHDTTYRVCFQPISHHLDKIKEVWVKLNADMRDLPDYSYSPMEYITQIGEHLITLPQHLEPFLSQENTALNSVLQVITTELEKVSVEKGNYPNVLLTLVAQGTCQAYADQILNIRELNISAVRQLAADINYISNVLEELGIGLPENLHHILLLLRFSPEEYQSKSIGFPPKLVAAIRQIRKIASTS